jgi:alanyl-tRNA synthetase
MISSNELRSKYLDFMQSKGHAVVPSASLVPKEDPTVLFTTAGMQPIIHYLTGQKHPAGNRISNSQKCLRMLDIDEVGDNRHLTFFEMLGNWSMGSYFKKEIIEWTFEFLTSSEYLGMDPKRLFVTVYKGSELVGVDDEAIAMWSKLFSSAGVEPSVGEEFDFEGVDLAQKPKNNEQFLFRITKRSGKDNWWSLPYKGPCGPCSEIYYLLNEHDLVTDYFKDKTYGEVQDFIENQIVEIWNNVFMSYYGEAGIDSEPKEVAPLTENNVDTGAGFERLLTVINGYKTPYESDVLKPLVDVVTKYQQ